MTMFAFNVGLKIDATGHIIPADLAQSVLASHGIHTAYKAPRVEVSATEPTLVGWFVSEGGEHVMRHAVYQAALALQQSAIAVVWPGDIGELIGPNVAAWGAFDPTRFITP